MVELKKLLILLLIGVAGCMMNLPMKEHISLSKEEMKKIKVIFIGEIKVFKNGKYGLKGIEQFGTPADDDPYFQELVKEYVATLKNELKNELGGDFTVLEQQSLTSSDNALIVKTKIVDHPPPLRGLLGGVGAIGARVEIFKDKELLLEFEEAVNTAAIVPPKKQIRKFLAPWVAKKIVTSALGL